MKMAIYGKGGIGKSTIAANVSAAMAASGRRVLQIGCDPKQDSTRLLLNGRHITTALTYLREVAISRQRLEDVLHQGYNGVVCVEAGGPEPGVGCAGRGILSTFALLDRLGLDADAFDVILYDVLGDVVCGGFAVPLRKDFADIVYIVTSEEFMSLYAANNILKGVRNFEGTGPRLAGLILNSRGDREDAGRVRRFAGAVGLPIVCRIPRSDVFRRAETRHQTVIEAFGTSAESGILQKFTADILSGHRLFNARPLDDPQLDRIFSTGESVITDQATAPSADFPTMNIRKAAKPGPPGVSDETGTAPDTSPLPSGSGEASTPSSRFVSKSLLFREPLHGCAFSGAISTLTQIGDAITIAHGPRSCSHIALQAIIASGIRAFSRKQLLLPEQLAPALISSDMNEGVVIYGGRNELADTLGKALKQKPQAVFVVTTCPAGVIGEAPESVIRDIAAGYPDIPVLPITTDGNIHGDHMQGVINACLEGAARLIDPERRMPCRQTPAYQVNIIAEKNIANNAETNFTVIAEMLQAIGIGINCRFVRRTSTDGLKDFLRAPLNLPAYNDYFGRILQSYLSERFDAVFTHHPFPVGFGETCRWLTEIAAFFGREKKARALMETRRAAYEQTAKTFRPALAGKRIMIMTYLHDVDWMVETARDLGMHVEKVGLLHYCQDHVFHTRFAGDFEVEKDYSNEKCQADLKRLRPDLLLCNYIPENLPFALHTDTIPLCPDVGIHGGLRFAARWAALLKAPLTEGWKKDAELFT